MPLNSPADIASRRTASCRFAQRRSPWRQRGYDLQHDLVIPPTQASMWIISAHTLDMPIPIHYPNTCMYDFAHNTADRSGRHATEPGSDIAHRDQSPSAGHADRQVVLKSLAQRVAVIEQRGRSMSWPTQGDPHRGIDAGFAYLPRGLLHEWHSAVGVPMCLLTELAHRALAMHGNVFWVGQTCLPYPRALFRAANTPPQPLISQRTHNITEAHLADPDLALDLPPPVDRQLLDRSIIVDPPRNERLWAIDTIVRSPATTAVIADGSGMDMTATRRLQLAAEAGKALVLLYRPARELAMPSAAAYRWLVEPTVSPTDHPRWQVQLRRCKDAGNTRPTMTYATSHESGATILEWHDDAGIGCVSAELGDRTTLASRGISPAASTG